MKKLKRNSQFTRYAIASFILCLLMQGCMATAPKELSESDLKNLAAYDGKWFGVVKATAKKQFGPGNWILNCNDRTGQRIGPIQVANGEAKIFFNSTPHTVRLGKTGKFAFSIPLNIEATQRGGTMSSGKITYLLTGWLKSGKGFLTYGVAELSNAGCTSKIVYTKQ